MEQLAKNAQTNIPTLSNRPKTYTIINVSFFRLVSVFGAVMATTIEQIVTFGLNRGGISFRELSDYAAEQNMEWFRFITSSAGCLKTIDAINQINL